MSAKIFDSHVLFILGTSFVDLMVLFCFCCLSVLTFPKTIEYFIDRTMDLGGFSISQYSFWFGFL